MLGIFAFSIAFSAVTSSNWQVAAVGATNPKGTLIEQCESGFDYIIALRAEIGPDGKTTGTLKPTIFKSAITERLSDPIFKRLAPTNDKSSWVFLEISHNHLEAKAPCDVYLNYMKKTSARYKESSLPVGKSPQVIRAALNDSGAANAQPDNCPYKVWLEAGDDSGWECSDTPEDTTPRKDPRGARLDECVNSIGGASGVIEVDKQCALSSYDCKSGLSEFKEFCTEVAKNPKKLTDCVVELQGVPVTDPECAKKFVPSNILPGCYQVPNTKLPNGMQTVCPLKEAELELRSDKNYNVCDDGYFPKLDKKNLILTYEKCDKPGFWNNLIPDFLKPITSNSPSDGIGGSNTFTPPPTVRRPVYDCSISRFWFGATITHWLWRSRCPID
jgi:hypothetical protein